MSVAWRGLRAVRAHVFLCAIVLGLLVGGGLRLVPNDAAAASGDPADGPTAPTACAAQ